MSYTITLQYLPERNDGKIEIIYSENPLNNFDRSSKTWKSHSFENCLSAQCLSPPFATLKMAS